MNQQQPEPVLVSACLLGLNTRYDGSTKANKAVAAFLKKNRLIPIPICPEQLAGLPTPRQATRFASGTGSELLNGKGQVVTHDGTGMNEVFVRGAYEVLKIAELSGCSRALLKERSPSCGVHQIFRGEEIVAGEGVTAALLVAAGLEVFSEEDL